MTTENNVHDLGQAKNRRLVAEQNARLKHSWKTDPVILLMRRNGEAIEQAEAQGSMSYDDAVRVVLQQIVDSLGGKDKAMAHLVYGPSIATLATRDIWEQCQPLDDDDQ